MPVSNPQDPRFFSFKSLILKLLKRFKLWLAKNKFRVKEYILWVVRWFKFFFFRLVRRYKETIRQDWLALIEVPSYFIEVTRTPASLKDFLECYTYPALIAVCARTIFKLIVWWPFAFLYSIAVLPIRYTFVLWHFIFLDIIFYFFPVTKVRAAQGWKRYPMRFFFRLLVAIYKTGRWVDKFIAHYCGIFLFFPWIKLSRKIPGWISRNKSQILYPLGIVFDTIAWMIISWDKLWFWFWAWFNPWSYHKTRFYLQPRYRQWYKRRIMWSKVWWSFWLRNHCHYYYYRLCLHLNSLRYPIVKVYFVLTHLPISIKLRWEKYNQFYFYPIYVVFSHRSWQFQAWAGTHIPWVLYGVTGFYYRLRRFPLRLVYPIWRFLFNYWLSKRQRWSKDKGPKTKKIKTGHWKKWPPKPPKISS